MGGLMSQSVIKRIPITASARLLNDKNERVLGGVETLRDHSLEEALRKRLGGRFQMGDRESGELMKIAVTIWEDHISPVFDAPR